MAIRKRWEPEAEETHEIMRKATEMAMREGMSLADVIAVAKLHLDAHRQIQSDEHHDDRLDYYDRALEFRRSISDAPVLPITINGGQTAISIFLPNNERDELPEGQVFDPAP